MFTLTAFAIQNAYKTNDDLQHKNIYSVCNKKQKAHEADKIFSSFSDLPKFFDILEYEEDNVALGDIARGNGNENEDNNRFTSLEI